MAYGLARGNYKINKQSLAFIKWMGNDHQGYGVDGISSFYDNNTFFFKVRQAA